jgi:GNAT superfamily N-acetyltransferase
LESISKTAVDLSNIVIEPLDCKRSRAAFCCGNDRIDNFFRNNARRQHEASLARVYAATDKTKPEAFAGYYYLVASSSPPEHVSEEALQKFGRVKSAPCVYLGMLGVQKELQRGGIGRLLILHAMQTTLRISELAGIYALTLHAVDEETAATYGRWGFEKFIDGELEMFIPIGTIRKLIPPT